MNKKIILVALLIIGLAASVFTAAKRYQVESRNKAVEMVVDYDEVLQVAAATGNTPVDVLRAFKSKGITGISVSEDTMRDAADNGEVMFVGERGLDVDPRVAPRIASYLAMVLPHPPKQIKAPDQAIVHGRYFETTDNLPLHYLLQLPVGLPEQAVSIANQAKVDIIARVPNYPGATPKAINAILDDVKKQKAHTIIFSGDQVLGFKGAVEDTADALRDRGLNFGRIEFSKQKGDDDMAKLSVDHTITVHSITQNEMPTLNEASIIDRFQKGVRERGVRICYVRMYNTASGDLLNTNAEYIEKIAKSIRKAGYSLKVAHPIGEMNIPRIARVLAGIGVAAGVLLLVLTIVDTPGTLLTVLIILFCAGLAGMGETGRKLVALFAAISFPTLAAIRTTTGVPEKPTASPSKITQSFSSIRGEHDSVPAGDCESVHATIPNVLPRAIGRLLMAILTTAIGGLLIVGLLSQRDFMLRVNQFMGVKLAHLLPVVILAIIYAGRIAWKSSSWKTQKEKLLQSFREIAANPILMWQAAAAILALAVIGLMVARSGNDSGVGVSSFELRFRSILDKVLYVRPRTKEFLIGYPLLLVGIAFALRGLRRYAAPLIVIGSIGLISALNSFCHIHTPIMLTLIRVINGMVVGLLFGLVVYSLVKKLPGKEI